MIGFFFLSRQRYENKAKKMSKHVKKKKDFRIKMLKDNLFGDKWQLKF